MKDQLRPGNLVMSLYRSGNYKDPGFLMRDIIGEIHDEYAIMKNGEKYTWDRIHPMPFAEIQPQSLGFFPDTDTHEWVYRDNTNIKYKPGTFNSVHELQNFLSDQTGRKMDGILFE